MSEVTATLHRSFDNADQAMIHEYLTKVWGYDDDELKSKSETQIAELFMEAAVDNAVDNGWDLKQGGWK